MSDAMREAMRLLRRNQSTMDAAGLGKLYDKLWAALQEASTHDQG